MNEMQKERSEGINKVDVGWGHQIRSYISNLIN